MLADEIKKIVRDFSLVSTAHGLPNIFKSKRLFNRLFWLFFVLSSSIISCYFIYLSVLAYFEYDVITIIKTEYDQPAEFPTVTFCSRINGLFDNLNQSIFKEMSFGYDKSLINDPFNHLETFFTINLGRCFRFNSGKNLTNHSIPIRMSTIGGRDDCFSLKVNPDIPVSIWIHNRTTPPNIEFFNNHDNYYSTTNGSKSHLAIHKTVEYQLGMPYNQCLKNLKSFKKNLTIINQIDTSNQSYTHKTCLQKCFELYYIEKNPCNCTNTSLGNVWLDCWIKKEKSDLKSCTYTFKIEFYKNILSDMCRQYCPIECDSVTYLVTPNDYSVYDNLTSVIVYYESLKYTLITQSPKMQTFDLVSNVGGILGLFVGISFVNLFEISEILLEIALVFYKRFNNPNGLNIETNESATTTTTTTIFV